MIENNNDNFYIHDVIHKAFIEVDEKGSKAAAVTGVSFGVKTGSSVKNKWIFNRPFLYAIMDKRHMIPLFIVHCGNMTLQICIGFEYFIT